MRVAFLLLGLFVVVLATSPAEAFPARRLVVLATEGAVTTPIAFDVASSQEGALSVSPARSYAGVRIRHAADGIVRGSLAGGDLLVIAEEAHGRDASYAGVLWRVAAGRAERILDGLAYGSRPLVVGRRALLQRGRAGTERLPQLRVDSLSLLELDLDTGATRELLRIEGQLVFPIGLDPKAGLLAYLVGPPGSAGEGGRLVAIDREGRAAPIAVIGTARDFSLSPRPSGSGARVVFEGREGATRVVAAVALDGRRETLMRGGQVPLAPVVLPDGSVYASAPGPHGRVEIVRTVDAATGLVVAQRYLPGSAAPELVLMRAERGQLGPAIVLPTPDGTRLEPVGFTEVP